MKKILFTLMLMSVLFSCQNSQENDMLRRTIEIQNSQLAELEQLKRDNIELKEKLNHCMFGNPNENVQKIGNWLDNRPGADIQMTLNKNIKTGKYYVISKLKDGTSMTEQVRVTKVNGQMKFESIENSHNEWYIIEKNGDLSMWSQNGKFGTALCF